MAIESMLADPSHCFQSPNPASRCLLLSLHPLLYSGRTKPPHLGIRNVANVNRGKCFYMVRSKALEETCLGHLVSDIGLSRKNNMEMHVLSTVVESETEVKPEAILDDSDGGSGKDGRDNNGWGHGGGGGGGGGDGSWGDNEEEGWGKNWNDGFFELLLGGWHARVRTDPQFPFKLLTEEVIGVGACVIGDMASRPNFGLNELDFVFSTLVVGCILNFVLMYMLAPTSASAAAASKLPGVFAGCPSGHMFEPGAYTIIDRAGTFLYKGALFAVAGFTAGLVGTTISNMLLDARKKVDPNFVPPNKPPPTLLNAATWALHMGLSSNIRYQALNGLEFSLAKMLNPAAFKACVFVIRGLNNVLGGTSFVMLARLTGAQKVEKPSLDMVAIEDVEALEQQEKQKEEERAAKL